MPQPPTDQEQSDIREVVAALGSGHFTADQIYRTHSAIVTQHSRSPMHPIRLGQVLREYGAIHKQKWDGSRKRPAPYKPGYMVKGWII